MLRTGGYGVCTEKYGVFPRVLRVCYGSDFEKPGVSLPELVFVLQKTEKHRLLGSDPLFKPGFGSLRCLEYRVGAGITGARQGLSPARRKGGG